LNKVSFIEGLQFILWGYITRPRPPFRASYPIQKSLLQNSETLGRIKSNLSRRRLVLL
jgi:hypothetical protein